LLQANEVVLDYAQVDENESGESAEIKQLNRDLETHCQSTRQRNYGNDINGSSRRRVAGVKV